MKRDVVARYPRYSCSQCPPSGPSLDPEKLLRLASSGTQAWRLERRSLAELEDRMPPAQGRGRRSPAAAAQLRPCLARA
jgi:hypothetical protein